MRPRLAKNLETSSGRYKAGQTQSKTDARQELGKGGVGKDHER